MSVITMLIIGGWAATLSFIGICALNEAGKLQRFRRRLALWLDASLTEGNRAGARHLPNGAADFQ